jgi:hypothetical protein
MTHQTFIHRFVLTPLMKYDMTLERMIQAHNYFIWIFSSFSQNYEKSVPFANKRYWSPHFAVNRRIIWISNEIFIKGANEYSNILNKKIFVKMKYINLWYLFNQRLKFLKVEIFRKNIYCENVFWKEIERNWNENAKTQKYFDFSDSNHARSELQTSSHHVHYHQIPVFP